MNEVDRTKPPGIQIGQIFLEEVQFSHREDFLNLPHTTVAQVGNLSVQVETSQARDARSGLVRMRVWTNVENKPVYNLMVAMTALVAVDDAAPNMPLSTYLKGPGAAMLYPFVRQVVADLTWRGRFGPVWLSPTNVLMATATAKPKEARPAALPQEVPDKSRKS